MINGTLLLFRKLDSLIPIQCSFQKNKIAQDNYLYGEISATSMIKKEKKKGNSKRLFKWIKHGFVGSRYSCFDKFQNHPVLLAKDAIAHMSPALNALSSVFEEGKSKEQDLPFVIRIV